MAEKDKQGAASSEGGRLPDAESFIRSRNWLPATMSEADIKLAAKIAERFAEVRASSPATTQLAHAVHPVGENAKGVNSTVWLGELCILTTNEAEWADIVVSAINKLRAPATGGERLPDDGSSDPRPMVQEAEHFWKANNYPQTTNTAGRVQDDPRGLRGHCTRFAAAFHAHKSRAAESQLTALRGLVVAMVFWIFLAFAAGWFFGWLDADRQNRAVLDSLRSQRDFCQDQLQSLLLKTMKKRPR